MKGAKISLVVGVLFLSCFGFSCARRNADKQNRSNYGILKIDLLSEPESKVSKLSEFAANIEYIPLQTVEGSLMGKFTRKIINVDKSIYILNNGEILCFDIDGKFLFKINKRGRGPGEYTDISDFDVSTDNKTLTVLSTIVHKLLVYRISETGFSFQRSITLKDPSPYRISIVPETGNAFLSIPPWRGTEPTLSLLIDSIGDTIHIKPNCYKYTMVSTKEYRATNEMLTYSIGSMVCFKEKFSDTVFYADSKDNSFKPRIIFDSHGKNVTPEMRGGAETVGNNISQIANIFETSRYIFYYYGTREIRNRILFDKKTNSKYKLDIDIESGESKLKDDLSGGQDFNVEFLDSYCSGNKLFSFADAIILKKYVAGEDFKNVKVSDLNKKNELKKIADSLTETDNPVLIILTPKE